jgi:hypothetical protein
MMDTKRPLRVMFIPFDLARILPYPRHIVVNRDIK